MNFASPVMLFHSFLELQPEFDPSIHPPISPSLSSGIFFIKQWSSRKLWEDMATQDFTRFTPIVHRIACLHLQDAAQLGLVVSDIVSAGCRPRGNFLIIVYYLLSLKIQCPFLTRCLQHASYHYHFILTSVATVDDEPGKSTKFCSTIGVNSSFSV